MQRLVSITKKERTRLQLSYPLYAPLRKWNQNLDLCNPSVSLAKHLTIGSPLDCNSGLKTKYLIWVSLRRPFIDRSGWFKLILQSKSEHQASNNEPWIVSQCLFQCHVYKCALWSKDCPSLSTIYLPLRQSVTENKSNWDSQKQNSAIWKLYVRTLPLPFFKITAILNPPDSTQILVHRKNNSALGPVSRKSRQPNGPETIFWTKISNAVHFVS